MICIAQRNRFTISHAFNVACFGKDFSWDLLAPTGQRSKSRENINVLKCKTDPITFDTCNTTDRIGKANTLNCFF